MLKKHGAMIPHTMTKYDHTDMAFIEALNKLHRKSVQGPRYTRVEQSQKGVVNLG